MYWRTILVCVIFATVTTVLTSCYKSAPVLNSPIDSTSLSKNDTVTRPTGWTFDSHDANADPNYDIVFPENIVNRMDITVSDSAWKALNDDMTSMAGAFGTSKGMGGMNGFGGMGKKSAMPTPPNNMDSMTIPQEFYDAAVGKQQGDSCVCSMMGMALSGIVDTLKGKLYCNPSMGNNNGNFNPNGGNMNNTSALPREPAYIPATIDFIGKRWTGVGFRLKGNSSLMSAWGQGVYKLPFHVKMDKFEDAIPEIKGQRMYGFQDLSLINNYMDNTMIHEKIASELFRSFDVPSCKATFIRLYVDYGQGKKYFGLYTMDEMPEGPLLKKWFGNKKGNLYKPDGSGARFVEFVDGSFAEKNNHNTSCQDVKAVFEALHGDYSNPASWRKELEKAFDVPIFLKWLAVNSVIANWDAYGSMPHNYYLYNDNDKLKWIPWDLGLSFSESGGMGIGTFGGASGNDVAAQITHNQTDSTWPLIRHLLDDATYRAKYFGYVRAFLQTDFTLGSLTAKIQSAKSLVAPYVTGAEPEQTGYTFLTTPQDFETAHNSLVQFISKRINSVDSVLAVSH